MTDVDGLYTSNQTLILIQLQFDVYQMLNHFERKVI
jgi:hypothetical protein